MDAERINRNGLSERRGQGMLMIYHDPASPDGRGCYRRTEGTTGGLIEGTVAIEREVMESVEVAEEDEEKMSYFRWQKENENGVTVEELSRDFAASGLSPGSSPSSKFRAALPGRSPRWPHTYHHRSMFSFPALCRSATSTTSATSKASTVTHFCLRVDAPDAFAPRTPSPATGQYHLTSTIIQPINQCDTSLPPLDYRSNRDAPLDAPDVALLTGWYLFIFNRILKKKKMKEKTETKKKTNHLD